ncbi:hypothetical protein KO493_02280 [Tamlana agarivorans]|uniref:Uncharacterized protein n=1 Tax=Pseudotamlana agarivorans TaxID=481183 RepID=A0ACC5U5E5_9FLAO|nr:hypothetical protein [Tamlana agarivorans]
MLELGLKPSKVVLCFIFFAAISGYNFVKFFSDLKFYYPRLANRVKAIPVLTLFSVLMTGFYMIQLQTKTVFIVSGFAVLTVLYSIPFLRNKTQNLRHVEGLKVYIIAFVWMGVSVFLPVIESGHDITKEVLLMGLQRFAYVLVLMLPFEIRDLKYDPLNLKTIPQKIGVKKTKLLGVVLLVFMLVLEYFKAEASASSGIALGIVLFVTGVFVWRSKQEQAKYYCAFWVEALPVVWLILMLIVG